MVRHTYIENVPLALLYLALTGNIDKKDLELYLIDKPKLAEVLLNFNYYSNKYRKRVVVNYLWDIMSKYKEADIMKRLRLLSIDISFMGSDRLKLYTPYLVEIAAMIEKKAREYGVLDHRLEQAFDDLYNAIKKEKIRPSEVISALTRIYTLVELSGAQKRMFEPMKREEVQMEFKPTVEKKRVPKVETVDESVITTFLEHVEDCEKKGNNQISKVISSFFAKHSNMVSNISEVYSLYKDCLRKGYVSLDNKRRICLTDKGRKLIHGGEE